jgi:hypothetical protein
MTIRETLDRDTKYTQSFRAIIASGQVEPLVFGRSAVGIEIEQKNCETAQDRLFSTRAPML